MVAFYNEIDPLAAQTIREAIARGLIAPGIVDERDIRDIRPDELTGYSQVHLFAGGGIWSYVLRRAGWPDDRPVWTCSCPCQPFSTAGKGEGFADERHLWPAAEWLIRQCEPECILGEQVADKGADPWIDLVQADLEALDYAFGIVPLASAGFGAPNIRHRSFWVAPALGLGCEGIGGGREDGTAEYRSVGWLGDAHRERLEIRSRETDGCRTVREEGETAASYGIRGSVAERSAFPGPGNPGPTNGFWRDADWLYCRDPRGPRWRPVDVGTFPLAPGNPARVGGLRLSGNAINAEVATAFIEAVIDALSQPLHDPRRKLTNTDRAAVSEITIHRDALTDV